MINFFHTNQPEALLLKFGPIEIYWYGLFIVIGILTAISLTLKLAQYYKIQRSEIIDLSFYLIIFGIIGARLYHVFLEFSYYLNNPLNILKVWEGGMAIHGALIAGIITLFLFTKKHKLNIFKLIAIITPGIALGQAIGRWGNYFNQELFGLPTDAPWGIPIELNNRILEYISFEYFHPTFLYESIGNFFIFIILIALHIYMIKKDKIKNFFFVLITSLYLILYSILRFSLEFIRIDTTPVLFGLRFPQIVSVLIILIVFIFLFYSAKKYLSTRHDSYLKNKKLSDSID
jgi:phosphatidylglycerol---prolipoprotein diacylglyceryl transferase